MDRNFSVGQAGELVLCRRVFDLHNWYDFVGLVILMVHPLRAETDGRPMGGPRMPTVKTGQDRDEVPQ